MGQAHAVALSAGPWAWVHLTAFDRAVAIRRLFVAPMTARAEQRQTYDEVLHLGRILQVPDRMLPLTIEDHWVYFDEVPYADHGADPRRS